MLKKGDIVECSNCDFDYPLEGRLKKATFVRYIQGDKFPCLVKSGKEHFKVKKCRLLANEEITKIRNSNKAYKGANTKLKAKFELLKEGCTSVRRIAKCVIEKQEEHIEYIEKNMYRFMFYSVSATILSGVLLIGLLTK